MLSLGIKNMYLGVVQSNNNVLSGQVQAGNDSLIGCNVFSLHPTTFSPRRFYHVTMLEARTMSRFLSRSFCFTGRQRCGDVAGINRILVDRAHVV